MALTIHLHDVGKKFGKEWLFRHFTLDILPGARIVINGGNGSGKSTLLQTICGFITPNEGKVSFTVDGKSLENEHAVRRMSFSSPYLQLADDLTVLETVKHTFVFKPLLNKMPEAEALALMRLSEAANKKIRELSSGMRQRLKTGLAILSETDVLLLDEPVSNFDKINIQWYRQMIESYAGHRTIIVCSNEVSDEHFFCTQSIALQDLRPSVQNY